MYRILNKQIFPTLSLSQRGSLFYRNQSIDLQNKYTDWFLYVKDTVMKALKQKQILMSVIAVTKLRKTASSYRIYLVNIVLLKQLSFH